MRLMDRFHKQTLWYYVVHSSLSKKNSYLWLGSQLSNQTQSHCHHGYSGQYLLVQDYELRFPWFLQMLPTFCTVKFSAFLLEASIDAPWVQTGVGRNMHMWFSPFKAQCVPKGLFVLYDVCDLMKTQASGNDLWKERQTNGSLYQKHFVLKLLLNS